MIMTVFSAIAAIAIAAITIAAITIAAITIAMVAVLVGSGLGRREAERSRQPRKGAGCAHSGPPAVSPGRGHGNGQRSAVTSINERGPAEKVKRYS
jgi:hypothetical protein